MIPFHDFGGPQNLPGGEGWLHFHHANGYPPQAYRPLLERLCRHYHVVAMRMRALWPGEDPGQVHDWHIFSEDLARFLDQQRIERLIGVGHSIGATTTLRLALRQTERFQALVLIDPVLFPPRLVRLWKLIYYLGLGYRVHPLVKGALRRRNSFESRDAMFANYRKKPIFRHMNDESLAAYVEALACEQPGGGLQLCYPPEWEARVYVTSMRADLALWRDLSTLKPPVLVIRGAETDTFGEPAARLFQQKLPKARLVSLSDTTHLVPLEAPEAVFEHIYAFLTPLVGGQPHMGEVRSGELPYGTNG